MVKIKTLPMMALMALMLLTIGCKHQSRAELIEKFGREKMEYIEKKGFPKVQKMIVNNLKNPKSYEPISTDMSIVTSDMVIYDSYAFVALRDLERATRNFNEEFGNDTTSQEARSELDAMQNLKDLLLDRVKYANILPGRFEGIDVYHQFYAEDRPGHKTKKGYHVIFHKNNQVTLLCDHDEYLRVKTFARQLLKSPPFNSIQKTD